MLLIVAVAFAAMSCGNKCCNKCCNADTTATDTVEVVEAEAAVGQLPERVLRLQPLRQLLFRL